MAWVNREGREFALILLAMGELFETPVSEQRAELFTRAMEDLPFEHVKAAMSRYSHTGLFFPKPVEIRDLVLGNDEDAAEEAWTHVRREIRRVGWMGVPCWIDKATEEAALGLFGGGWRALCERLPGEGPELLGYRKQFIAAYGAARRRQGALAPTCEEAKATLDGLNEEFWKRGLPAKKPN